MDWVPYPWAQQIDLGEPARQSLLGRMKAREEKVYLGVDVGSVTVNAVLVDDEKQVVEERNRRLLGEPLEVVYNALAELIAPYEGEVASAAVTGSGGKEVARLLGATFVNEVIAHSASTAHFHPGARTIIEIGGEDAKLIFLEPGQAPGQAYRIADFAMNSVCSAGTGSFLDQQAFRLDVDIRQFGDLALDCKNPPRIAGRCSVFAKSDMIHLQQIGTPRHEVVAGLCQALVRNFVSVLAAGRTLEVPVVFQGGVAANKGIRQAFSDLLCLGDGELVIPRRFMSMGAIGAVLHTRDNGTGQRAFRGLEAFEDELRSPSRQEEAVQLARLAAPETIVPETAVAGEMRGRGKIDAYLGIDVGSVSTNLVLLDDQKRVLAKRYLRTQGKPIEAVQQGLGELRREVGDMVQVVGAGTTGSGRYLIGEFVGADVIRNEISAQAAAAVDHDPSVDTIFEIGGQDSKYISVDDGVVVDFNMNHACAAGTGSFLEEQAEQLGVDVTRDFADLAFRSEHPVSLADKCTVFMSSDLNHHQQKGARKEDLVAGLSYSIVQNYINKVVKTGKIGERVFFQGGVAFNKAVVSAFENVTGQQVVVPPHHEMTGAIGAALLARENRGVRTSRFRGFDLSDRRYEFEGFQCQDCPNVCNVNKITVSDLEPIFYGSRCGKHEGRKREKVRREIPDLFAERERWLFRSYPAAGLQPEAPTIGIPRALVLYELMPLFMAFFSELGFRVILSDKTNETIARKSAEVVSAEFCFPVKVAHGHVLNLLEKDVDYLFIPSVQEMPRTDPEQEHAWLCPWTQGLPAAVLSVLDLSERRTRVLQPAIWFSAPGALVAAKFVQIGRELGKGWKAALAAYRVARAYQREFYEKCSRRGKEVLEKLAPDDMALVIMSRSYNGSDQRLNLDVPGKLRALGVLPIPMDFLPLEEMELRRDDERINWKNGQRFVKAARFIGADTRLFGLFITSFNCGPDAFIRYYVHDHMGGKPWFELEVDEHSSDTGMITRCEAFVDSLDNRREHGVREVAPVVQRRSYGKDLTLYLPQPSCLNSLTRLWQAAYAAFAVDIRLFPDSNEETLEYSRRFATCKECYPYQLVIGDMVRVLKDPSIDKSKLAFMLPVTPGACRLLGYPKGQRAVLDRLGYSHVPLVNPTTRWKEGKALVGRNYIHVERLLFLSNMANELLLKRVRETRPYEVARGETNELYGRLFDELLRITRNNGSFDGLLKEAAVLFDRIPTTGEGTKPVIGVLGELYVRTTPFANGSLEEEIEELGGEVWIVPLTELLFFRNKWFMDDHLRSLDFRSVISWMLTDWGMKVHARRYERYFQDTVKNPLDSIDARSLQRLAAPYVYGGMWGETVPNVGKVLELMEQDSVDGIVMVGPFACMPTTLSNALTRGVLRRKGSFPFLSLSCEGLEKTNALTRLEAFMFQAQQYMHRRTSGAMGG